MSAIGSIEAITAANSVLVEWIQSLPRPEAALLFPDLTHLVMTYDHLTDVWALHIVSDEYDSFGADVVSYACDFPVSVQTAGDIAEYLKSSDWLETLFRMSQDYDGFHGPYAANLD